MTLLKYFFPIVLIACTHSELTEVTVATKPASLPELIKGSWETACFKPKPKSKFYFKLYREILDKEIIEYNRWHKDSHCKDLHIETITHLDYRLSDVSHSEANLDWSKKKESLNVKEKQDADFLNKKHGSMLETEASQGHQVPKFKPGAEGNPAPTRIRVFAGTKEQAERLIFAKPSGANDKGRSIDFDENDQTYVFTKVKWRPLSFGEKKDLQFVVFPISTEMEIGKASSLLHTAPRGAYVSVGGERSFRGASMAPKVEELIIIDISPEIMRFARINAILLKAETLTDYRKLRWAQAFEDWKDFSNRLEEGESQNLTLDDFSWWQKNVVNFETANHSYPEMFNRFERDLFFERVQRLQKDFEQLDPKKTSLLQSELFKKSRYEELAALAKSAHVNLKSTANDLLWWQNDIHDPYSCGVVLSAGGSALIDHASIVDYKSGNYVFDENLYNRLHGLAKNGKIHYSMLDLRNSSENAAWVNHFRSLGKPLAVLDLDNAFFPEYLGKKGYKAAVDEFVKIGNDATLLVIMDIEKKQGCLDFQTYSALTFKQLRDTPEWLKASVK